MTFQAKTASLVPLLLNWFAHNARNLPWRKTRDPYAIWISEIMLQQTQVQTVIPYWNRWRAALSTIRALARARPARLHKLWEGLGYYTRVRNLHRAARVIVRRHEGRFPENFDAVLALPGIGRYTAGAICSIAFNQPTPVLDGNVVRVLARVFGIGGDPHTAKTKAALWDLAGRLVMQAAALESRRAGRAGCSSSRDSSPGIACSHLNQSLMELGAVICTPRQPKCDSCPVRRHCVALKDDRTEELPRSAPRPPTTSCRIATFVIARGGRFLVRQRAAGVVNARLWEFPNVELATADGDIRREACALVGATAVSPAPFCVVRHSITRNRIVLEAYRLELTGPLPPRLKRCRWVTPQKLKALAFPSAHRQIAEQLMRCLPRHGPRRPDRTSTRITSLPCRNTLRPVESAYRFDSPTTLHSLASVG